MLFFGIFHVFASRFCPYFPGADTPRTKEHGPDPSHSSSTESSHSKRAVQRGPAVYLSEIAENAHEEARAPHQVFDKTTGRYKEVEVAPKVTRLPDLSELRHAGSVEGREAAKTVPQPVPGYEPLERRGKTSAPLVGSPGQLPAQPRSAEGVLLDAALKTTAKSVRFDVHKTDGTKEEMLVPQLLRGGGLQSGAPQESGRQEAFFHIEAPSNGSSVGHVAAPLDGNGNPVYKPFDDNRLCASQFLVYDQVLRSSHSEHLAAQAASNKSVVSTFEARKSAFEKSDPLSVFATEIVERLKLVAPEGLAGGIGSAPSSSSTVIKSNAKPPTPKATPAKKNTKVLVPSGPISTGSTISGGAAGAPDTSMDWTADTSSSGGAGAGTGAGGASSGAAGVDTSGGAMDWTPTGAPGSSAILSGTSPTTVLAMDLTPTGAGTSSSAKAAPKSDAMDVDMSAPVPPSATTAAGGTGSSSSSASKAAGAVDPSSDGTALTIPWLTTAIPFSPPLSAHKINGKTVVQRPQDLAATPMQTPFTAKYAHSEIGDLDFASHKKILDKVRLDFGTVLEKDANHLFRRDICLESGGNLDANKRPADKEGVFATATTASDGTRLWVHSATHSVRMAPGGAPGAAPVAASTSCSTTASTSSAAGGGVVLGPVSASSSAAVVGAPVVVGGGTAAPGTAAAMAGGGALGATAGSSTAGTTISASFAGTGLASVAASASFSAAVIGAPVVVKSSAAPTGAGSTTSATAGTGGVLPSATGGTPGTATAGTGTPGPPSATGGTGATGTGTPPVSGGTSSAAGVVAGTAGGVPATTPTTGAAGGGTAPASGPKPPEGRLKLRGDANKDKQFPLALETATKYLSGVSDVLDLASASTTIGVTKKAQLAARAETNRHTVRKLNEIREAALQFDPCCFSHCDAMAGQWAHEFVRGEMDKEWNDVFRELGKATPVTRVFEQYSASIQRDPVYPTDAGAKAAAGGSSSSASSIAASTSSSSSSSSSKASAKNKTKVIKPAKIKKTFQASKTKDQIDAEKKLFPEFLKKPNILPKSGKKPEYLATVRPVVLEEHDIFLSLNDPARDLRAKATGVDKKDLKIKHLFPHESAHFQDNIFVHKPTTLERMQGIRGENPVADGVSLRLFTPSQLVDAKTSASLATTAQVIETMQTIGEAHAAQVLNRAMGWLCASQARSVNQIADRQIDKDTSIAMRDDTSLPNIDPNQTLQASGVVPPPAVGTALELMSNIRADIRKMPESGRSGILGKVGVPNFYAGDAIMPTSSTTGTGGASSSVPALAGSSVQSTSSGAVAKSVAMPPPQKPATRMSVMHGANPMLVAQELSRRANAGDATTYPLAAGVMAPHLPLVHNVPAAPVLPPPAPIASKMSTASVSTAPVVPTTAPASTTAPPAASTPLTTVAVVPGASTSSAVSSGSTLAASGGGSLPASSSAVASSDAMDISG